LTPRALPAAPLIVCAAGKATPLRCGRSTQSLDATAMLERVSKWLFLVLGAYVALCVPAILVAERAGLPEWPLHMSQFVAVVCCVPSSAIYLWTSRRRPFGVLRALASVTLVLSVAWIGLLAHFIQSGDFGDD
jgi:hypothetical protein